MRAEDDLARKIVRADDGKRRLCSEALREAELARADAGERDGAEATIIRVVGALHTSENRLFKIGVGPKSLLLRLFCQEDEEFNKKNTSQACI